MNGALAKDVLMRTTLKINYANDTARFSFDEQSLDAPLLQALNQDPDLSRRIARQVQVQTMLPSPPVLNSKSPEPVENPATVPQEYVARETLQIQLSDTQGIVRDGKRLANSGIRWLAELLRHSKLDATPRTAILVELRRQLQLPDTEFLQANLELVSLFHAASQPPTSGATSLSRSYVTLRCLGFVDIRFEEPDGDKIISQRAVAFCFAVPESYAAGHNLSSPRGPPQVETLFEMLQRRGSCPPLDSRFGIAKSLLRKYYNFLRTGWLHKGLRSHNVVFLRSNFKERSANELEPHIMGFEYARSFSKTHFSEKEGVDVVYDKYRHPVYRENRDETTYRLSFDLFSLGVILIELAYWKSVAETKGFPGSHALDKGELSQAEYKLLCMQVGTRYAGVVQDLLRGDLGDNSPVPSLVSVSQAFSDNLLRKLDECEV